MDEYVKRKDAEEALYEYRMSLTMSQFADVETCIESRGIVEGAMNVIACLPTADVVPKSECRECADRTLKAIEVLQKALQTAREDVAREIFEEIEKQLALYSHIHRYAEEAKKVTEEYADGTPCEMTSVWDVLPLHKNGWDDYETMNQLQDNIQNIEKSRLLKELESDIAELKKKYTEENV